MNNNRPHLWRIYSCALVLALVSPTVMSADALDKSRAVVSKTNTQLKQAQNKIDKLHTQTAKLEDKYRSALREIETYEVYNKQLQDIVDSQNTELESLQEQIIDIEVTAQQIMPMMQRMIEALEQFVAQDIPFLPVERSERIAGLYDTMKRADVTVAEKYRKILESYQIEIEYGKTLEAYAGNIRDRKVNFLKVGRTAFFYQTLDKQQYAVWDKHDQAWKQVKDHEVQQSIDLGMKIARKQHSPELLTIMASQVEVAQ